MAMNERTNPLEAFQKLGAIVSLSTLPNGSSIVCDIQCRYTGVGDEHAALLSEFPELRSLGLQGTHVTNAALAVIKALPHLESLDLADTQIDDAGLEHLAEMKSLELLHIQRTNVTDRGLRSLRRRLPKCKVCHDWS
jgi:hypothetical protein